MYDVRGKLLNSLTKCYGLSCLRVKEGERECSKMGSGMRQDCIMSPWPFNVFMNALMKEVKWGWERSG